MRWVGQVHKNLIATEDIYRSISILANPFVELSWFHKSWKWNFPLKLKCFSWLVLNDKVLTWNNFVHRGFIGPSTCMLCKQNLEDVEHFSMNCLVSIKNGSRPLVYPRLWRIGSIIHCWQALSTGFCHNKLLAPYLFSSFGAYGAIEILSFFKISHLILDTLLRKLFLIFLR